MASIEGITFEDWNSDDTTLRVELSETDIHVDKGVSYAQNIVATVYNDSIYNNGVSLEYSQTNIAWVTMLRRDSEPDKTWLSIKGLNDGITTVKVKSNTDPTKYAELTIRVGSASTNKIHRVELTKQSLVIVKGKTVQIRANVIDTLGTDSAGISWTESDTSIVTIVSVRATNNPTSTILSVKGSKVGSTTVIIRSKTDPSKYATLSVSVVATEEDAYTPVLYVTSSETSVTLPPSSTFTLIGQAVKDLPEAYPSRLSGYVGFESSDSSIANITRVYTNTSTLNRADIATGTKQGTATIIVYSKDDPSKTATCIVNVRSSSSPDGPDGTSIVNPVSSVSINESNVKIAEGGFSQLSVTVVGQYTNQSSVNTSVIWSSSNGAVVSVDENGRIFGLKVGTATIVAVSAENKNIYGTCVVSVRERKDSDGPIVLPDDKATNVVDTILRVDYNDDGSFKLVKLFEGDLNFDSKHPIESVVYHETDDIQKIYWVDGKNVLRFMNFMAEPDSLGNYPWQDELGRYDNTYFDSNREADFGVSISITKDNSGNVRANGVTQYFLTYYNKYGQETNYVWTSDLVYLSPFGRGGAADETNQNKVTLTLSGLDTRFTNFRIYSIFRSSLDGQVVSYLVAEGETSATPVIVSDDGAHLEVQDPTRLLYLGSQPVHADTLTHKDQVLFLGNLNSVGRDYTNIETAIKSYLFDYRYLSENNPYLSSCIQFIYSDEYTDAIHDIPYSGDVNGYGYENQLLYSSSEITTFKGGERYRFGLKFKLGDGTETDAFWIGDADNNLYPEIDDSGLDSVIKRVVVKCTLPAAFVRVLKDDPLDIRTVQLLIAQATYADRSVKAQGIVNPTVFNTWERYSDRVYSFPSWIARPRGAGYAWGHFTPIHNSIYSHGEIECNYWSEDQANPTPFYQYDYTDISKLKYVQQYNGASSARAYKVIYQIVYQTGYPKLVKASAVILRVYADTDVTPSDVSADAMKKAENVGHEEMEIERKTDYWVTACRTADFEATGTNALVLEKTVWSDLNTAVRNEVGMTDVDENMFIMWVNAVRDETGFWTKREWRYFSVKKSPTKYDSWDKCESATDWTNLEGARKIGDYVPAYFQKHLMFVDENVVTLHSPEFQYEAVSVDSADLKFRLVGAAKITSGRSDYTVDASHGYLSGENLVDASFSWSGSNGNSDGLISWPFWKERGISVIADSESKDIDSRTSADYVWGETVYYWLHMWNKSGSITGYYPEENETNKENGEVGSYSVLNRKVFANLRYSYKTIYKPSYNFDIIKQVRQVNPLADQFVQIEVGSDKEIYSPNPNLGLTCPGAFKYKVLYSDSAAKPESQASSENAALYSSAPVQIAYRSQAHAVISLPSEMFARTFTQTILPYVRDNEFLADDFPMGDVDGITQGIIPWKSNLKEENVTWDDLQRYTYYYAINQDHYDIPEIGEDDKYLFIGELYQDKDEKTLYGGISETAIANCRFIVAGPQYALSDFNSSATIYGNQGDTFFQRWDCLQTMPYSDGAVNNVIDITSVMVETHINIDGRTDKQRDISELASIDTTTYGQLNRVYSQSNNYVTRRDLTEDKNVDSYQSSITWTMEKADAASIDEWTHITLASTLKLDGDKGDCRALRRFQNSIISFQDRGIAEILFNSRTQISTQDGVPIEIANSGKVDGKRYITSKYGCTNKWSIVEGKNALYFVDNINKAFCGFSGNSIDNISNRQGFSVWFRNNNDTEPWNPLAFNNIVSYYDRIHSDIYLETNSEEQPCLVYNENLGVFTSFFDYRSVLMMTNVRDKFVSFNRHALWLQNEGLYCNFFGQQYDAWSEYRVTPEPYSDKVWTNLEYRTDFYRILDSTGEALAPENEFTSDEYYQPNETYDYMRFWNEYQTTADEEHYDFSPEKKFRLWRLQIPRAIKEGKNKFGLDRIRNPWMNLIFKKRYDDTNNTDLMQIHDITAIYYE